MIDSQAHMDQPGSLSATSGQTDDLNYFVAHSPANPLRRIAAYWFDVIIAFAMTKAPAFLIVHLLSSTGMWNPVPASQPFDVRQQVRAMQPASLAAVVIAFVLASGPIYFILCHASPWQATLGKRLLGIYVADAKGRQIGIARSLRREIAMRSINAFGGGLISIIFMVVSERRKALHDYLAKTIVLNGQPDRQLELWRIAAFCGVPVVWLVATLVLTL